MPSAKGCIKITMLDPEIKERNLNNMGIAMVLAGVFVTLVWRYGGTKTALEYSWMAWITLGCARRDAEEHRIPQDLLWIGIVGRIGFILKDPCAAEISRAMAGGPGISVILLLIVLIAERYGGGRFMGGGDIKLVGVTGTFLGWKGNWTVLLLACMFGAAYGAIQHKKEFPWGPCITAGAWIVMLAGSAWVPEF